MVWNASLSCKIDVKYFVLSSCLLCFACMLMWASTYHCSVRGSAFTLLPDCNLSSYNVVHLMAMQGQLYHFTSSSCYCCTNMDTQHDSGIVSCEFERPLPALNSSHGSLGIPLLLHSSSISQCGVPLQWLSSPPPCVDEARAINRCVRVRVCVLVTLC